MSWSADSTAITADQTCFTADGYNGCGVAEGSPNRPRSRYAPTLDRIREDDEEILTIIAMAIRVIE